MQPLSLRHCSKMHALDQFHFKLLKELFHYIKFSQDKALIYEHHDVPEMKVYADSNFVEDVFGLGVLTFCGNNLISWISRKQQESSPVLRNRKSCPFSIHWLKLNILRIHVSFIGSSKIGTVCTAFMSLIRKSN